jgi:hypothetical protein
MPCLRKSWTQLIGELEGGYREVRGVDNSIGLAAFTTITRRTLVIIVSTCILYRYA